MPTELAAVRDTVLALPAPVRLAALAALAAFVLVSFAAWLFRRHRARGRAGDARGRAVLALARRGAAPSEIARRTRLSRDAVGLALRLGADTEGAPVRQNSPAAAEAAVPRAARPRAGNRNGIVQRVLRQWVRVFAPLSARRARALPLGARVQRSDPPHRQAA